MSAPLRLLVLRIGGVLLLILGVLHLAVTPLIAQLIDRAATLEGAAWLTPPMLLNHVVVGILLLPLGGLTLYAAPDATAGVRWAIVTTRAVALTVATFPPVILLLMGTEYLAARPFLVAVGVACAAAVTLLLAAFWPAPPSEAGRGAGGGFAP
jgi:hypothetical protein